MPFIIKNIKKLVKLGPRGIGVFLGPEARPLKWKAGDEIVIAVYERGNKKGIVLEKR